MGKFKLILLGCLVTFNLVAQTNFDSLWGVWQDAKQHDTIRIDALHNYSWNKYMFTNPDSAFYFAQLAVEFCEKNKLKVKLGKSYNQQGVSFAVKGDFDKAIEYYNQCLHIYQEVNHSKGIASSFNNIGGAYHYQGDYTKAIEFYKKGLEIQEQLKNFKGISSAYNNMGVAYDNMGDYDQSIACYEKSLAISKQSNDVEAVGLAYTNLGVIYVYQGNYYEAIDSYTKALKIFDELGDNIRLAALYNNIGNVNLSLNLNEKAIEEFTKSLHISQEVGDKMGVAYSYVNIGGVYFNQNDFEKAITFYKKSLELRQELDNKKGVAECYNMLGNSYLAIGNNIADSIFKAANLLASEQQNNMIKLRQNNEENFLKAEDFFSKSLAINQLINAKAGISESYLGLGKVYYQEEDYHESKEYGLLSYNQAEEIGNVLLIKESSLLLYQNYKQLGYSKQSLNMYEKHIKMRDSLGKEANKKEVIRQDYQYNYEKQAAADSVKHIEAQKIKQVEIEKQKLELKSQKNKQYLLYGSLFIALLFSVYFVRKNKEVRDQKTEVERQKEFAEQQQQIAEDQKAVLGQQHREITDSINYAQNLQRSVLPSKLDVSQHFSQSFVLLKPKDVVSGDFYWTYKKGGVVYLAVVDCTGHGVPGAFMTIVANNLLNEIIQGAYNTPKEIVEELHQRIKLRVGGSPTAQVRDSMDLGLFSLNEKTREVRFVGTHTSICLVRNSKLTKYKGSKADIGYKPDIAIEEQVFQVETNDMLYMHSDGYPDQKGGPKGKKFYYQPIRKKFEEISLLNIMEQEQIMSQTFEAWKGALEQFDDVCMIGVRI
ncbi:MAG: tetratricopeptide repeat protein [Flavobacteriales bacterium]|jgi:tetratricopeptide (TPR) repeat protein/serine phosphatase RsbU (regulator of sigma subunit)|nr:tetratricopeptide repeat protein [Flavobacteriales bacterium]